MILTKFDKIFVLLACLFVLQMSGQNRKDDLQAEKELLSQKSHLFNGIASYITGDFNQAERELKAVKDPKHQAFVDFLEAKSAFANQEWAKTRELLEKHLKYQSENPVFLQFAREFYYQTQNTEGILFCSKALSNLTPSDLDYLADIIEILDQNGEHKEANEYVQKLETLIGDADKVLIYRVKVLRSLGKFNLAEQILREQLHQSESKLPLQLALCDVYLDQQEFISAQEYLQKVDTSFVEALSYKSRKAQIHYAFNQLTELLPLAIELSKSHSYSSLVLGFDKLYSNQFIAENPEEVNQIVNELIQLYPEDKEVLRLSAYAYFAQNQPTKAFENLKKSLLSPPVQIQEIDRAIAKCMSEQQIDYALELSQRGIDYFPDYPLFYLHKAKIFLVQEKEELVRKNLDAAKVFVFDKLSKDFSDIHYLEAELERIKTGPLEAIKRIYEGIEQRQENPHFVAQFVPYIIQIVEPEVALNVFFEVYKNNINHAFSVLSYAEALIAFSKYSDAQELLENFKLSDAHPLEYYRLFLQASVLLNNQKVKKAIDLLQECIELKPQFQPAYQLLDNAQ